ncbi:hypothetical protein GCM10009735_00390 [Actinomadura chokoriensis]
MVEHDGLVGDAERRTPFVQSAVVCHTAHNARLSDISTEARVGSGALYTYYRSKHDLLYELMKGISAELTGIAADRITTQQDPPHSGSQPRLHQRVQAQRPRPPGGLPGARRGRAAEGPVGRGRRPFPQQGHPRHTAHALTLMVERVVMAWSYEGVEYDAEVLIDTLDKIWIRSLGLTPPPPNDPSTSHAASSVGLVDVPNGRQAPKGRANKDRKWGVWGVTPESGGMGGSSPQKEQGTREQEAPKGPCEQGCPSAPSGT